MRILRTTTNIALISLSAAIGLALANVGFQHLVEPGQKSFRDDFLGDAIVNFVLLFVVLLLTQGEGARIDALVEIRQEELKKDAKRQEVSSSP